MCRWARENSKRALGHYSIEVGQWRMQNPPFLHVHDTRPWCPFHDRNTNVHVVDTGVRKPDHDSILFSFAFPFVGAAALVRTVTPFKSIPPATLKQMDLRIRALN
ncbi:hypothetical protein BD410DRAFT_174752 [Rickenella mellea]|uniref:Uncharacterized protein n=1 Tax=Rickenella mellea TaxID=50990 RepID=A0A4Y7Q7P4_9AGAM|nr:hypothetical protein BD410DRAFT_174752 [Rickenella mellea]